MEPARWQKVNDIVVAALEYSETEQARFIAGSCGEDEELRREVESLLAVDEAQLTCLGRPILDWHRPAAEAAGGELRVGPYRVLEQLGRGGMGTVYLAVREDDEVQRPVALKVLQRGLGSADALRRFHAERRILARLDHPYIARLYEGGRTVDQQPYFVMEYVQGERIDRFCDARRLGVRQRIELFLEICEAVQYAHRNLVVHRDLKPSNILVTAEGHPKLLDFGIAKLLDPDPDLAVTVTATELRILTPDYASPEQIAAGEITVASDVYSLGVLLYELLTGHRPYRLTARCQGGLLRAVHAEPPERPSTVVARVERRRRADGSTETITPEAVGQARGEDPRHLRRRLSGDLDNILLMALRREPQHRYGSVEQLCEDLRRYQQGRPVLARHASFLYRTGKFLRRHWRGAAAATGVVAVLAGFAVEREAQQHETALERDRAQRVSQFLVELFEASDPHRDGGEMSMAEVLERGARRIEEDLAAEPELQATLMETMGRVYCNRGDYPEAESLLRRAADLRRQLHPEGSYDLASTLSSLGRLMYEMGELKAALAYTEQSVAMFRQVLGPRDPEVATSLNNLAVLHLKAGDLEAAEEFFRQALAIQKRSLGAEDEEVLKTQNNLATLLQTRGDREAAEALFREVLAAKLRTLGEDHPGVALALNNLALLLAEGGDNQEAKTLLRRALAIALERYEEDHPNVLRTQSSLARTLLETGEEAEAEALLRQVLERRRQRLGADHPDLGRSLAALGQLLADRGEWSEARPLLVEALEILRRKLPPEHQVTAQAQSALEECLRHGTQVADAR